jgi:hypothetical protein
MANYLNGYGWEFGNIRIPSSDYGVSGINAYVEVSTVEAKTGSYCMRHRCDDNASRSMWARFPIPTLSNPSASVWVYNKDPDTYSVSDTVRLYFRLDGGTDIQLRWDKVNATYDLYIDGLKVADGSWGLPSNAWHHLQLYTTVDASIGTVKARLNGHLIIDYTGNTAPNADTGATYLYCWTYSPTFALADFYWDDLAIGYGGFLGDCACVTSIVNGDTVLAEWTPSIGVAHYAVLDEVPPNDGDYVETDNDGDADELTISTYDGVTYKPLAVVACARAAMVAATGDSIRVGIDSGGVDEVTESLLSTSVEYYDHIANLNPNGAIPWTAIAINALKVRYESVIS